MKKEKFVDKVYKLTRDVAPLSYMLPTRHTSRFPLLHFDEETGVNREMRYARNQKSIFVDEQDGNAIVEPIIFEDGFLRVPKNNQPLQQFLSKHPLNGTRFEEVNYEQRASDVVEVLNMEADALIAARTLSIDQLENIARALFTYDVTTVSTAELKRDILVFARNNPGEFLNVINDPMLKHEAKVQEFFDASLLIQKGDNEVYFNTKANKKRMLVVPNGESAKFTVAHYLQSDEGIETLKMLEKMLEKAK
tara:strand:- start:5523 stop:6272 length:750 start_codon:yes stop_codon:yes gene_type:complete